MKMKIVRKCVNCGNEYDSTDRKNASLYCGKDCKDSHVADNVKEMFESVTEGLGQAVEMEELNRLRAENEELKAKYKFDEIMLPIETKVKQKSDEIWKSIRSLYNYKANITNLIAEAERNMRQEEERLSNAQHEFFMMGLTFDNFIELSLLQREILSKRSAHKSLMNAYKIIDKMSLDPEYSVSINYGVSYKLKNDIGSFSFGDNYDEFLKKQQQLVEEENKKVEEKEALSIQNEEVLAFAEELNSVPIKGRMITTISFQKHSLADLKAKYAQLEPRCKALRVDVSKGTITTYN